MERDGRYDGHTYYNPSVSTIAVDRNKTFELAYGSCNTVFGEQYND